MIPECKDIRKNILTISHQSGHGHIPSCFSVVESLFAVYSLMPHDPRNPAWEGRDIFILSKGHAALAQYCVLGWFGYFGVDTIHSFGNYQSDFGCHADRCKVAGVEVSTGSLGHGIGIAVGMALAFKVQKSKRKVYVLIGDGEANEGYVWEAVMMAVNLRLDNLTVIYDNNMSQLRGLQIHNPAERFSAFGCETVEVNGHDVEELESALQKKSNTVKIIVGHTKKGYGCKTLVENQYEWHRKSPTSEQLQQLCEELDATAV